MRATIFVAGLAWLASLPAEAAWSTRTVAGMETHVYVPAQGGERGLIIGLHGCTQSNEEIRDRGNWTAPADRYGFVVAVPMAPGGGVLAGCWDYYGANHTRANRHNGPLLQLVDALLGDAALNIEATRVYVAGLSSGASEAMVMGCLAPDIFAGVGINAGPTLGTASSEIARVATDLNSATALCRRLAGAQAAAFETQLASIILGNQDYVVAQGYGRLNAQVLASVYDSPTETAFDLGALPGVMPAGQGNLWSDARGPRVSLIVQNGMGHAFPAGSGMAGGAFVYARGVAWPEYLMRFFTDHHRRGTIAPRPDAGMIIDAGFLDTGFIDGAPAPAPDAATDLGVHHPATDSGVVVDSGATDLGAAAGEMSGGCQAVGWGDVAAAWLLLGVLWALSRPTGRGFGDRR